MTVYISMLFCMIVAHLLFIVAAGTALQIVVTVVKLAIEVLATAKCTHSTELLF